MTGLSVTQKIISTHLAGGQLTAGTEIPVAGDDAVKTAKEAGRTPE